MTNKSPILALKIPVRKKPSLYPPAFASRMDGREKRQMGDFFGLTNFGINLTRLKPNAISSLRHSHSKQDEFIYILQGHPTLITPLFAEKKRKKAQIQLFCNRLSILRQAPWNVSENK